MWAFNPTNPVAGQAALAQQLSNPDPSGKVVPIYDQYVRVVGSLVTDDPHLDCYVIVGCINADPMTVFWRGSFSDTDPANPARWTEVHPPDVISVIAEPNPEAIETVRCVSVGAPNALLAVKKMLDLDIAAPSPGSATATLAFKESVDTGPGYTVGSSIADGQDNDANGIKDGAKVDMFNDHIHVHVAVESKPFFGTTGKFKACYRVFWQ
jgi:hypothetical protein